jgi:hypothetical protein
MPAGDVFASRFYLISRSALHGCLSMPDSKKPAAAAENTEKSNGAFTPNATVIANAKPSSSTPLHSAVILVLKPTSNNSPSAASSILAVTARKFVTPGLVLITAVSFPLYCKKFSQFPHATPFCPGAPHQPIRSATAERKEAARASLANKEKIPVKRISIIFNGAKYAQFITSEQIQMLRYAGITVMEYTVLPFLPSPIWASAHFRLPGCCLRWS